MTPLMDHPTNRSLVSHDVVESIRELLRASPEPMTLPKLRASLPSCHRTMSLEELAAVLERQVAAGVVFLYPKYRSGNERYWDRPLRVHVLQLLRRALACGPLSGAELRRRLPDYANILAEAILQEEILRGRIFPQPPLMPRMGIRYALAPASPAPYLRKELDALYERMEQRGFDPVQVRRSLLALLHAEEDWKQAKPAVGYTTMEETVVEGAGLDQTLIPETMF